MPKQQLLEVVTVFTVQKGGLKRGSEAKETDYTGNQRHLMLERQ